ncbi:colorectal mutant cancer protein isoform X2 [Arctopsyche grandis]|uniref:colorectal mutant cancer protein isoform X2 n=1 Tax=Arctopsyche grandis TaxID=121162 RepID=UPI00406D95E9
MSGMPFDDSLSETSSIADEERVRKLFQACDYNGDGYIDSSDLEMVCQELELGQCVQELLTELGADRSGRVSYKDFLSRRKALRCQIEALKIADTTHSGGESSQDIPASASNSGNSFSKQELWEWDSGARDLSPEPLVPPSTTAPPDAIADLASTLHLAAVSSLKNEVLELSARLHAAHRDRDTAREALCTSQSECNRLRSALAAQARASEERLTELHGVIAELRRAGAARERAAIPELREDESELETSCREGSITGGAVSDRTTSPGDADETASITQEHERGQSPVSPAALPIPAFPNHISSCLDVEAQSKELYASETNGANLSVDVKYSRTPVNLAPDSPSLEEETLDVDRRFPSDRRRRRANSRSPRQQRRDICGVGKILNESGITREDIADGDVEDEADIDDSHKLSENINHFSPRLGNKNDHRFGQSPCLRGSPVSVSNPQTKLASRVRLRKTHEDSRLTGKDICQEGVYTTAVAEHLARGALYEHDSEELIRLGARVDRLEADNVLLSATLRESKEHADRLSLICAQCSAEAGALRVALAAADRAVEAYDVLLALAETAHGKGNNQKLRAAAERVAKQLLARLDDDAAGLLLPDSTPGPGPWSDPAAVLLYLNSSGLGSTTWTQDDEERLRNHVSRLKRERTMTACGAQPAPWPLQDENDGPDDGIENGNGGPDRLKYLDPIDARKLDMETAVLMQEVMSLREERAELRARLRALRPPVSRQTNSSSGIDEGESEWRLLEALARENSLKIRLQKLMASVQQAGKVGDIKDRTKICPHCGAHTRSTGDGEHEIAKEP